MNPLDLPIDMARTAQAQSLVDAVRTLAQGALAARAPAIDQEGHYPEDLLRQLAAMGAMDAHMDRPGQPGNYLATMASMMEVGRVCGSTAFMMWCQAVCALYMGACGNPALTGEQLTRHRKGQTLGGTALSNPMKGFAQIEGFLLKARPVPGGYCVNGTLPWVSNLGPDHYCGAIAAIQDAPGQELMFLLPCNAPGVTLKPCPKFSGMEGTGTYAVACKDLFVGANHVIADPARPFIRAIRSAFVLLQCGMAAGVAQGAIDSMWEVEGPLGHVNQYLDDRPTALQAELDDWWAGVAELAQTPMDDSKDFFLKVLTARLAGGELCLRAANSALMHHGARGYLLSSAVQRRVREAQFVAIVTPALKHLRKEIAALCAEEYPA